VIVAIAGSRRLPKRSALHLVRLVANLGSGDTILLRKGLYTPPGRFEHDVAVMAGVCGVFVQWRMPIITEQTKGRASVYARDIDMVADADVTVLLFTGDDLDDYSGTAHLFEKCMDLDRPCYAYEHDGHGFVRWADNDPDNLFADVVP
jgi:hypothetical protein